MFRNSILNALPEAERKRVEPRLERIDLKNKQVLYDVDEPIEHVFFVEGAVASLLSFFDDGISVETATIGNEGMVGLGVFLHSERVSEQAFVLVDGPAHRMSVRALKDTMDDCPQLAVLLGRYTNAFLRVLARTSACKGRHTIQQRCARWLLLTNDRVGRDTFTLTHQSLAQMLGVRRASVSSIAGKLQKAGCIEYNRGTITIVDRAGLEKICCECYRLIRDEFARATRRG